MADLITSTMDTLSDGIGKDQIDEFLWLVVLGGFVCFAMAWGIGANDVANCFATSVGSRAINLKQATIIAGIFEFVGAVGLGGTVTSTVRKGIVDWDLFVGEEDILMLGMFCSLLSASVWMALATKYELPVSTTQSVVGAIAGFAICAKGSDAIHWIGQYDDDGKLEKYNGVLFIALFWIGSPFFAAICSVLFFMPIRNFLLRRSDSYEKTLMVWPFFVFLVVFIMYISLYILVYRVLFLLMKGLKRLDWDAGEQMGMSFGIAIGTGAVIAFICWMSLIRTGIVNKMVTNYLSKEQEQNPEKQPKSNHVSVKTVSQDGIDKMSNDADFGGSAGSLKPIESTSPTSETRLAVEMSPTEKEKNESMNRDSDKEVGPNQFLDRVKQQALRGVNEDIHDNLGALEKAIQDNSEDFDPKTERAFSWLQVCTATLDIFAHGSNDVANAVAPFAAMVALYEAGKAEKEVPVYEWILVIGAAGMVLGLATYGYKIMKCLGVRMAPMTCTRGYCIELSSALVVILASHYGFPTSTTHAQVGATVGVGLVELSRPDTHLSIGQVVNWKLLAQVLFGWVLTLFISGISSALIFSLLAFSPYAGQPIDRS